MEKECKRRSQINHGNLSSRELSESARKENWAKLCFSFRQILDTFLLQYVYKYDHLVQFGDLAHFLALTAFVDESNNHKSKIHHGK